MNDVRHQISVDPTDYLGIHISQLKKDWHVGVPRTSLKKNHIDHPPLLRPHREADFWQVLNNSRHACFDRQEQTVTPSLIGTGAERSIEEVKRGLSVFASS